MEAVVVVSTLSIQARRILRRKVVNYQPRKIGSGNGVPIFKKLPVTMGCNRPIAVIADAKSDAVDA